MNCFSSSPWQYLQIWEQVLECREKNCEIIDDNDNNKDTKDENSAGKHVETLGNFLTKLRETSQYCLELEFEISTHEECH